jgi:hypothetical protein
MVSKSDVSIILDISSHVLRTTVPSQSGLLSGMLKRITILRMTTKASKINSNWIHPNVVARSSTDDQFISCPNHLLEITFANRAIPNPAATR